MKKITAETFLEFRFPGSPRLSPDGNTAALLLKQASLEDNCYLCDIWIVPRGAKARQLTARGDVADYCWSPGGDIIFTRKEDHEPDKVFTNYYKISPAGGEAVLCCTLPVRGACPEFLPDGSWLVKAQTDLLTDASQPEPGSTIRPRTSDYRIFEEVPFWSNGNGDVSRRRQTLFVCDPSDGSVRRLSPEYFDVYGFNVCEGQVLITGAEFDDVRPHEPGLYIADTADLSFKQLIEPGKLEISDPVLLSSNKALLQIKVKGVNRYECGAVYSFDLYTGLSDKLCDPDMSIQGGSVTTDSALDSGSTRAVEGGKLFFTVSEFDSSYIRTIDELGNISPRLTGEGSVFSLDARQGRLIYTAMRGDGLPELYELAEGKEIRLTDFNDGISAEYQVSTPEFMSFTASDGFEIHGWVMKPADYQPGKKYPAILNIHGGPRGIYGSVFCHEMQLWAARGYFVIYSNPRGSDGRGRSFADLYGKYGDLDYKNIMDFTDECLSRYPDMDADRLGVTGGSYGGYMTNWIIGHTGRFKAACAQRSISNWISYEGTGDISYWFNGGEHGAELSYDAQKLWDISPMKYADKAVTPTLFIHSQEDYRCFMGEGIAMYTVLKMHSVDTRLVLFKGENHNLSRTGRPRPRLRRLEEIAGWMDKYLKEDGKNA